MRRIAFVIGLSLLVYACSSEEQNANNTADETIEQVVEVVPNRILTMEIDGMVCKMGCGGSIRKELKATGGVSNVEFDFEEDRATNIATISFDKDLITVDEMVKVVSKMNDGQFTVGETNSEDYHSSEVNETTSNGASESANVNVSTRNVKVPNLFDLLSGLLLN